MWLKSKGHLSQVLERMLFPYMVLVIYPLVLVIYPLVLVIYPSTSDISSSASDISSSPSHVVIQLALKGKLMNHTESTSLAFKNSIINYYIFTVTRNFC